MDGFLSALLTLLTLVCVCNAQDTEDSHMCIKNVTTTKYTKEFVGPCKGKDGKEEMCWKKTFIKEPRPVCCEGYKRKEKLCVPNCKRGCKQGTCVAPDICMCDPPLVLKNSNSCERPLCNPSCVNGKCINDDQCDCYEGFTKHNATYCASICSEGFVNDPQTLECKPKCDNCNFEHCTAPNVCTCNKGYVIENSTCVPICSNPCKNGKCVAPDTCECDVGYRQDSSDKSLCNPICEKQCINATCVEPDTCSCLLGFEKYNRYACKPFCGDCENGVCKSPDNCQCNDGYTRINGKCKPVCTNPCINGFCESPEKCGCNDGYIVRNPSVCYKPCVGECDNGICNDHGKCLCNSGYELFNSTCIVPGNCDECSATCPDGDCQCEDGRPCHPPIDLPAEAVSSTSLAGLQMTWVLGGCIGILLVTIVIITIGYIWKKRREYGEKPTDNGNTYPSVAYTIPNTLIQNYGDYKEDCINENDEGEPTKSVSLHLLEAGVEVKENEVL